MTEIKGFFNSIVHITGGFVPMKMLIKCLRNRSMKFFYCLFLFCAIFACSKKPTAPSVQQSFETFQIQYPVTWMVYGDSGANRNHRTIVIGSGNESSFTVEVYAKNADQSVPSVGQRVKSALMQAVESEEERNNANFTVGEVDLAGSRGAYVEVSIASPTPRDFFLESYRRETENSIFLLTFQSSMKEHVVIKPYIESIYTSIIEKEMNR